MVTRNEITGRRPRHGTVDFDKETHSAVIEQLVRADYVSRRGWVDGCRVLDVGCGTGYTCHYFRRRGAADCVVGLEIDQEVVLDNRRENDDAGVSFEYYDGGAFPFPAESFQVVTCFEVLEHVPDETQNHLISEIGRVLKPSGMAVISTPYRPVYSPDGVSLNPDHINELDDRELTELCQQYFGEVEPFGQRMINRSLFEARRRHHLLSNSLLGRLLKNSGFQRVVRNLRTRRPSATFEHARKNFSVAEGIDETTLVQIAVCKQPRHVSPNVADGHTAAFLPQSKARQSRNLQTAT